MAKRVFASGNVTFTASAAGSQATGGGYMTLVGSSATQITDILEVMISGKASASTVAGMYLNRASTLGTGGATALAGQNSDGAMNPATAALASPVVAAVDYVTNESIPSATVTDGRLQLGLNLFGGIIRWNAAPTQQMTIIGNAAPGGSVILWNSSTGGGSSGLADAHLIYEPY
jgi:hypothetical protein